MELVITFFAPITAGISVVVSTAALYISYSKEKTVKSLDKLKLKIAQELLKGGARTQTRLLEDLYYVDEEFTKSELLGQLYQMINDNVITIQSVDEDEWKYSIVSNDFSKRSVTIESDPRTTVVDEKLTLIENSIQSQIQGLKERYTFEQVERWDSVEYREFRDVLRVFWEQESNIGKDDIYKRLKEEVSLRRSLVYIFNFFQGIQNKIKLSLIDESIVFGTFSDTYTKLHREFYGWFSDNMHMDDIMKNDLFELNKSMVNFLSSTEPSNNL